ncbi:ATP-grasp peptide maturase system methyltransferase [Umezawaea sp. Da 62-37]|uniref:ATP-grasp peptide maturase system methyltransferase n=1 Tax=Umezawaea sp. Da 62-37 TaxID=3075927 RepID=UPI0028F70C30|nr:ATP-grasp peptide maturase system methyltransferase [Umezawaea sp. Da 62-37]WNV91093.1 ATP-grasp peptide maturase system methyltransferase [Umezawaea sp. Da 62-37]
MRETLDDRAATLRNRMTDDLTTEGVLHDARWSRAFREVDRHAFLPRFFRQLVDGTWGPVDSDDPDWLSMVYRDRVCVTQLNGDDDAWRRAVDDGAVTGVPTCSSSMPTIMAIMLEALDARRGQSVLEIGTGTGYNAALLCHALGDEHVTTVDVDPGVLERARGHLAAAGRSPACAVGDGELGWPDRAPYDRVLCTCAVSRIPLAWFTQTKPGGVVVTTLNRSIGAGLVRLVSDGGGRGEGRVLAEDGRFMPLRAHAQSWANDVLALARAARPDERGRTALDPTLVVDPRSPFEFFAGLVLPEVVVGHGERDRVHLAHPDGSWARLRRRDRGARVDQGGPRRLWHLAEAGYRRWLDLGRPRRDRFSVTVGPEGQRFHFDGLDWPV